MHVVRKDVLLWALGGFALSDDHVPTSGGVLPLGYVSELKRLASVPRNPLGAVKAVADRYGRSAVSARSLVSSYRLGVNPVPRYWADAA